MAPPRHSSATTTGFRNVEEYRVTSYSANGIESDPSEIALGVPKQSTGVFTNGFEPPVE